MDPAEPSTATGETVFLERPQWERLIHLLQEEGYRCIGPQVREGAIVYDTLEDADRLPRGWRDQQGPGRYRLQREDSPRQFAWANGPQALKPLLFAPREDLWQARCDGARGLDFQARLPREEKRAVLGVRACDLAALALLDAHFLASSTPSAPSASSDRGGGQPDPAYRIRRAQLFLVAVDCSHPADTCFCAATGDGPAARSGYDLRLQELESGFLATAGSRAGAELLARLDTRFPTEAERRAARRQLEEAGRRQTRRLPAQSLDGVLRSRQEHHHWHAVAERCLSCGNCTAVCPTCFCHHEGDEPALDGATSLHYREWDSCFTRDHSYIHGIVIRAEIRQRYRQWLTHKLDYWHAQYGRSGCVGCGRCITWCPAGIDLTAEVEALCRD